MTILAVVLLLALLGAVGFGAFQFAEAQRWRQTAQEACEENELRREELEEARREALQHESESAKTREVAAVQLRLLTETQQQLEQKFRQMAAETLQNNSQYFLERSREQLQHLVEPVGQSLQRFEKQVQEIEKLRVGAYADLTAQVQSLTALQERVRQSTDQLKTALRSPSQRGRWGEMQLRRVVELAGMLEYCDFAEQETLWGETKQRPDLIVRLPNQCRVVVD
ncbi:MAG TPA: DNA recombination protein RmuC, partial [Bryobacteraceae bacterium]